MLPKRLDRTVIYESEWINLFTDRVLMPSGKVIEKYHFLDYPMESVVVVLVNADGAVCFVKSLRYTTQRVEWELPAGGVDLGESVVQAAVREVREETGFSAVEAEFLYSFNPSNGMSNQVIHIVRAGVGEVAPLGFDTDEVLEVHWLSVSEIRGLIRDGVLADGISLTAVLFYLAM